MVHRLPFNTSKKFVDNRAMARVKLDDESELFPRNSSPGRPLRFSFPKPPTPLNLATLVASANSRDITLPHPISNAPNAPQTHFTLSVPEPITVTSTQRLDLRRQRVFWIIEQTMTFVQNVSHRGLDFEKLKVEDAKRAPMIYFYRRATDLRDKWK